MRLCKESLIKLDRAEMGKESDHSEDDELTRKTKRIIMFIDA